MPTKKIAEVMAALEVDEDVLLDLMIVGATRVAEIALNDFHDLAAAMDSLHVRDVISEVRYRK